MYLKYFREEICLQQKKRYDTFTKYKKTFFLSEKVRIFKELFELNGLRRSNFQKILFLAVKKTEERVFMPRFDIYSYLRRNHQEFHKYPYSSNFQLLSDKLEKIRHKHTSHYSQFFVKKELQLRILHSRLKSTFLHLMSFLVRT